jgi:LPS export ABC transporter permease LptG/LPS export ABC transporter permease LptF
MRPVRVPQRLRSTIIDRYLVREIVPPTLLGLVLFTFILLLHEIAMLAGFLVSRAASLGTVLRMFVLLLPHILALTIPMAFLLGVLLAFGRMATESEIVAFRAGGVSPFRLVRPVLLLSLVAAAPTFYITADAYPRANQAFRELAYSVVAGKARTDLRPRVFVDDLLGSGGEFILYASDIVSATGEWKDLLLRDLRDEREPKLILARRGRLVIDRRRRLARLDLHEGTIYSFDLKDPTVFEAHGFQARDILLPSSEIFPAKVTLSKGTHELTLTEVSQRLKELRAKEAPRHDIDTMRIEWHKRFAIPMACVVFGLTGIGLSLGKRKEAKSAAFGASIALLFVYYVFLKFGEQFGENGMLPPVLSIWIANILFGAIAIGLLILNQREAAFDPLDPSLYTRWLPRLHRRRPSVSRPATAPAGLNAGAARPVRFWSLLDAYVARQYAGLLLLATTAFWSLGMLVEFMDLVDDVRQNGVAWKVLMHYLIFVAPSHLTLVLPVAYLVATLTTLGILARRNEITAMKAGGISLYRLAVPIVVVAIMGSGFLFALGDYVIPYTNRVAQRDHDIIKNRPTQSIRQIDERMVLGRNGRFYEFTAERQRPEILQSLRVYDVDLTHWTLREALFARQARWNPAGYYDLERGWRRTIEPLPAFRAFDSTRTREIESPDYFTQEVRSADTLRFEELRQHIAELARKGMDVVRLRVDLQLKLALPVVAVVMALLGIPFAFTVGRHGALHGIAISLVLAILYWICFRIFEALGRNAFLPPELAMWVPNVLFAAAAVYLLLCIDT